MILNVLIHDDLVQIRQASLAILERIGIKLQHAGARDLLVQHGCSVHGERVRIPGVLVERLLEHAPRSFRVHGRNLGHPLHYGGGEVHFRASTGITYVYDSDSGERRSPRLHDAQDLVRIVDALPGFRVANSMVYPADVRPEMVGLITFVNSCQFSEKPNDATVVSGAEVKAIARIAAVIRGSERALREKPLTVIYVSPTSPLSFAHDQADAVLEAARGGIPLAPLPCPILGVSAPITLAGLLAQQTAEVLAGLVIAYLVNPGLPIVYGTRAAAVEMRSGASLYGNPEVGMAGAASTQLAHHLGMPANACGLITSGKAMDEQVGFEKAINGLMAALAGCDVITGAGALEDFMSLSYQQLVIDDEMISMIHRCLTGIKVDGEMLALEVLARVMDGGSFLAEPHTRRFFRAGELWRAGLADRHLFSQWQSLGAKAIQERAAERVREVLATHQVEPLPRDVQREIDSILRAAERELAGAGSH